VSPTLLLPTSKIIEDSLDSAVADLFEARHEVVGDAPTCSDPYVVSLGAFWAISAPPKAGAGPIILHQPSAPGKHVRAAERGGLWKKTTPAVLSVAAFAAIAAGVLVAAITRT
jgi:hypothetical protein